MHTPKSLMRFLAMFAIAPMLLIAMLGMALSLPAEARGQTYTFGQWAAAQGYSPGDVMPINVGAVRASPAITSLAGIGDYNWTTTPTRVLALYENQISSIESGDFSSVTNLETLILDRNLISSVESGDFSGLTNLRALFLQENLVSSVEPGDFTGLTNLRGLLMNRNLISSIDPGDFGELTSLTQLELGRNQISSIEPGDFSALPTLRILKLDNNQISSIDPGDFSGLSSLTALELDGNRISSIEPGDFGGLGNLTWLDMDRNQISSIEPGDFSDMPKLRTFRLGGNHISSIDAGDFSNLPNMLTLKLNDNQIPSIEPGSFGGMPNLQMLILERNRISSIESGDFSTMTNLGMLYLGGNDISSIESGAFGGMNLGSLYLDGNDITSIGSGAFSNLMNLRTLSLSNNRSMTHLNMEGAGFSSLLQKFHVGGNTDITSVSLKDAVLNQTSLETLLDGGTSYYTGIGELGGITELDLSGVDFSQITDLAPLGAMDDLTDLWLLDVSNMDAVELDSLLDNLATMQAAAIEGILYLTPDDYNALNTAGGGLLAAWDNEDGHHVEIVPEPATLSLLALGGLAVIRRRRRKQ